MSCDTHSAERLYRQSERRPWSAGTSGLTGTRWACQKIFGDCANCETRAQLNPNSTKLKSRLLDAAAVRMIVVSAAKEKVVPNLMSMSYSNSGGAA